MKALRWKVFLEAWGPCLAIYLTLVAMTFAYTALFAVSLRKAAIIPGFAGVIMIPAVLQGHFVGLRNNHYWHEPIISQTMTSFPSALRLGLLSAVLPLPCYILFAAVWSLVVQDRIFTGLVLLTLGILVLIAWFWVAKRKVWGPLMAQTPPSGVSVTISNRQIFRESVPLLIVGAIGSACLVVGVILTYRGTWGMAIVAFVSALLFAVVTNQMGRRLPETPPAEHAWRK